MHEREYRFDLRKLPPVHGYPFNEPDILPTDRGKPVECSLAIQVNEEPALVVSMRERVNRLLKKFRIFVRHYQVGNSHLRRVSFRVSNDAKYCRYSIEAGRPADSFNYPEINDESIPT
jgi:hypothetical protein